MVIEALAAVSPLAPGAMAGMDAASRPPANDFGASLGAGLTRVDQSVTLANDQLKALAAGKNLAIHDVMITMEQARLELMLATEVRNKLVESYQELMRMQL
ncbi:flagellar hook-basal body complex protein FliE [Lysobacter pythonis]|uniref:Flagellar hook-basal body complex protein FliE n=1 Tax=Solilutibacter pythonis TaxID=2483112 RepID=A0A3M2I4S1_9GAMM|nr:flagellar hook-basal body complex protein FliE [Lysobacter pythonis]RMH94222.1 flagellar hook-basal body complex protein FliE [Lysobacter pythonis]